MKSTPGRSSPSRCGTSGIRFRKPARSTASRGPRWPARPTSWDPPFLASASSWEPSIFTSCFSELCSRSDVSAKSGTVINLGSTPSYVQLPKQFRLFFLAIKKNNVTFCCSKTQKFWNNNLMPHVLFPFVVHLLSFLQMYLLPPRKLKLLVVRSNPARVNVPT
jgi:hypothetical protein